MSTAQLSYRLVSLGRVGNQSEQEILVNLAKLYRTTTDKVQHFLTPETILQIVEGEELAEKYRRAYHIAGIQCRVESFAEEIPKEVINKNKEIQGVVYEYAGFGDRFFAMLADSIIFSLLAVAIFYSYSFFVQVNIPTWDANLFTLPQLNTTFPPFINNHIQALFSIEIRDIISLILTVIFWKYFGATLGKMSCSIKIVDAKTGNSPSTLRFIIRYFSYLISALPLLLGFIWAIFDKRKQTWHDKLAGTIVIKTKPSAQ